MLLEKDQNMYFISGNPKIMVQFCFKLLYLCFKSNDSCLGLQMARIEMDFNFKKIRSIFFKFVALCLGKLAETHIMVDLLFECCLDIFLLVILCVIKEISLNLG